CRRERWPVAPWRASRRVAQARPGARAAFAAERSGPAAVVAASSVAVAARVAAAARATMARRRGSPPAGARKPSAGDARSSPGSFDGVRLAQGLAAALELDLDAVRVAQLLVDLQRLVRTVHLVAVDAPDHVAVLYPDLRVERIGNDGEELEPVRHPVLERGHDPRLGGKIGKVGERVVDLAARDHVLVLGELPD